MLNFSNVRFHECIPKELHGMYDTLKLMEKQKEEEKAEAKQETMVEIEFKSDNLVDVIA